MRLCPRCSRSPWPFVMIVAIAAMTAFLTWLTLSLTPAGPLPRLGATALAFFAAGGTLLGFVLSCLRRHCRHLEPDRQAPEARG